MSLLSVDTNIVGVGSSIHFIHLLVQILMVVNTFSGGVQVLLRYGSPEQQKQWLKPLLEGEIRSGFAMTEPRVASSDATNIECSIARSDTSLLLMLHSSF